MSSITINKKKVATKYDNLIYLSSNGVHLDIIIPKESISLELIKDLELTKNTKYCAFGWGEENFYLNTPTWSDLTFKNAINALFLKNATLISMKTYERVQKKWIRIDLGSDELKNVNLYISKFFEKNNEGNKIKLKSPKYSGSNSFYKAKGNYSCFKTCNSWVNSGFKESGLKSCFWTPFDFGLLQKYK